MENRKERLFGYTTDSNFKKLIKIMKDEKISQSSILHHLVTELVAKHDAGKTILKGAKTKRTGPMKKFTDEVTPKMKKRTLRY